MLYTYYSIESENSENSLILENSRCYSWIPTLVWRARCDWRLLVESFAIRSLALNRAECCVRAVVVAVDLPNLHAPAFGSVYCSINLCRSKLKGPTFVNWILLG